MTISFLGIIIFRADQIRGYRDQTLELCPSAYTHRHLSIPTRTRVMAVQAALKDIWGTVYRPASRPLDTTIVSIK